MDDRNRISGLVSSLADPSRLKVVSVLAESDCCVSDLARRIGLSQSCTTRHLQNLQRAGVLSRTREGKRVLFRIRDDDPELIRVLELLLVRRPLDAPSVQHRSAPPTLVPRAASSPRGSTAAPSRAPHHELADLSLVPSAGGTRPNEVPIVATATQLATDLPTHSNSPSGREDAAPDHSGAPSGAARELEDYLL